MHDDNQSRDRRRGAKYTGSGAAVGGLTHKAIGSAGVVVMGGGAGLGLWAFVALGGLCGLALYGLVRAFEPAPHPDNA